MYLMARRIRAMGIKMVLSGEGSDEIFGGYLYFHKAPDAREFHEETVRKLDRLHQFDCLRANKSMAAWGVEARVPFLDRAFLDVAMRLDPAAKMAHGRQDGEAHPARGVRRTACPDEILWRQKEQFSDGVGLRWIDGLQGTRRARGERRASWRGRGERFPLNPPRTKEAYLYRDDLRGALPARRRARPACPAGPVDRVQHAGGASPGTPRSPTTPTRRAAPSRGVHKDSW